MKKVNFLIAKEQHPDSEWRGDLRNGVVTGARQCPVNLMRGLKEAGIDFECNIREDKIKIKNNTLNIPLNRPSLNDLLQYGKYVLDNSVIGPIGVGTPNNE